MQLATGEDHAATLCLDKTATEHQVEGTQDDVKHNTKAHLQLQRVKAVSLTTDAQGYAAFYAPMAMEVKDAKLYAVNGFNDEKALVGLTPIEGEHDSRRHGGSPRRYAECSDHPHADNNGSRAAGREFAHRCGAAHRTCRRSSGLYTRQRMMVRQESRNLRAFRPYLTANTTVTAPNLQFLIGKGDGDCNGWRPRKRKHDLRFERSPRESDDLRSDLSPKRGEVHATLMH